MSPCGIADHQLGPKGRTPKGQALLARCREARDASDQAIFARDAIADVGPEWLAAHQLARAACEARLVVFEAAYRGGALARPYWS